MTTKDGSNARGARAIGTLTDNGWTEWHRLGELQHPLAAVCLLFANGTFGGGTVAVQVATDDSGSNAATLADTLTANGFVSLAGYPPDVFVRVGVSGASSPNIAVVSK